ncbi:ornithine cyclodeaminase family protein [Glutamicibacter sp.]|uniref:ornithine cyclodeaminase family protein n=1 Tax=Glutamicibacter sp. TaxID=1931995 RepID=UPI0028BDBCE6|nr:ornithine cyclodeaminase family protein [Glutamicibacter sp.]
MSLPYLDADTLYSQISPATAVQILGDALAGGLDPEADSPRLFAPTQRGEFLIMPALGAARNGVKVLTVDPQNTAVGLPKIQGSYLLFDAATSAVIAVLDGTALTALRTPGTTVLALREMARATQSFSDAPLILVYGTGIQAKNHIRYAHALFESARFVLVGRGLDKARAAAAELAAEGIAIRAEQEPQIEQADVIICASSSPDPLFDGSRVAGHALVAAIGQHGLERRELDAQLMLRAEVVVEGRASALRENGNTVDLHADGAWHAAPPVNLRELVEGKFTRTPGRPAVYTGVGMAWEDLAMASAAVDLCNVALQ